MPKIKAAKAIGFGMIAIAVVASFATAGLRTDAAAQGAAVKTGCSTKIVQACKKNYERVCTQTDSKGCCKKSTCVQK